MSAEPNGRDMAARSPVPRQTSSPASAPLASDASSNTTAARFALGVQPQHEHEASAMASGVVGATGVAPGASSVRPPTSGSGEPLADDAAVARAASDDGHALPQSLRSYYEPRFGRDLGDVRIHSGGDASAAASSIDARAYTAGRDIVFGAGAYQPRSGDGQRLIAHELTHVLQQRDGIGTKPMRGPPLLQRQKVNDKLSKSDYDQRVLEGHVQPYPGLTLSWTEEGFVIWSDLELRGTDATQAKADEIKATITKVWMQRFPTPSGFSYFSVIPVITVTLIKPGAKPAKDKGGIELFRDATRVSAIEKIGSGTPRDRKMNINLNDGLSWTPGHEFGHYIGLDDHYTTTTTSTGGRKTTPDKGWEGDLMAEDKGKLSMRDIDELRHWWANWSA